MKRPLENKFAIITGANQGLGLEIARHYLVAGASLALFARNDDLLEEAKATLLKGASPTQQILTRSCDVSDRAEVDKVVAETLALFGRVDVLVNNAGVYGPMGEIEEVDWDDWVRAIEINLLGSILLCRAVLPGMKARGTGKIVQLSGGGATNPLPRISSYAVSKAAIVRFVETLAQEVRMHHIDVNAIAPGALNTRMLDQIIEAGPDKVGKSFYEHSLKQKESGGSPLDAGSRLAVFLGSDASNGITGKLISAVWDNWEDWPNHLNELYDSDVYTLRRIAGRDRNITWGDK